MDSYRGSPSPRVIYSHARQVRLLESGHLPRKRVLILSSIDTTGCVLVINLWQLEAELVFMSLGQIKLSNLLVKRFSQHIVSML